MKEFLLLHKALGFENYKEVLSVDNSGGLAMFWNNNINARIGTFLDHHIDTFIDGDVNDPPWRLTGFYGRACTIERDKSWQLLRDLYDIDSIEINLGNCLEIYMTLTIYLIGDFNEILHNGEKVDGPLRSKTQMRGFQDAIGHCDLMDLGYLGPMFTWWNSQTQLQLDRAMCAPTWWDLFGHSRLRNLPPSYSDYVPFLLQASHVPVATFSGVRRFKFELYWLLHSECDDVVREAWGTDVFVTPMYCVTQKIKKNLIRLDKWQKNTFQSRQMAMLGVRSRLEELLDTPLTDQIREEKTELQARLQTLLMQEEHFWQQREKVTWLKVGDRNTAYFHRKVANRKRKNTLVCLYDNDAVWHDDDKGMETVVCDYFTSLFTAQALDMEAVWF